MPYCFDDLIIFEMANNHQGILRHGLEIVEQFGRIAERHRIRAAVKLQYRDLETFIHPGFRSRTDTPHIKRFLSTRLPWADLQALVLCTKEKGMVSVVTPFDEKSVEMCLNHGVDVLKVASCSCQDWSLLSEVARAGKPIICSTGGCKLRDTDSIVTFLEHRNVQDFSLLHCVGKYPTQDGDQQLHFMRRMMDRYPNCTVGYSGHEAPGNYRVTYAAVAMGARLLERHVGIPTEDAKLNAYSMNVEQCDNWVKEVLVARAMLDTVAEDKRLDNEESISLRSLMRGAYVNTAIKKGQRLTSDTVFFAMPCQENQTSAKEYKDDMIASREYAPNDPLFENRSYDSIHLMRSVVHEAKGLLREARIPTGREFEVELSHHYGLENFRRFGAVIVSIVNREYCKKLVILLSGQNHPSHAHQKKEETFQVLHGEMELEVDGEKRKLVPGDTQLIRRGQYHSFSTKTGVVFEEISTTHIKGDSIYIDAQIARLDPVQRKTVIEDW